MQSRLALSITIARIALQRMWAYPGAWALALVLAGLSPLLIRLSPLGALPVDSPAGALALAWSFPVGLCGILWGLQTLSRIEEFLCWLPPVGRTLGEALALLAAAASLQAPLFVGAAVAAGASWGALELVAVLAGDLHLAALGVLALRLPFPGLIRGSILLALAWIAPSLMAEEGGMGSLVRPGLDPSHHLPAFSAFGQAPLAAVLGLAPIAALLLVGWLLLSPCTRASER